MVERTEWKGVDVGCWSGSWSVERSHGFVSGLILNAALILGVIVFEWSLIEIAVVYVIELIIINFFFLSVALSTPQLVDDRDGDMWNTKPTPL